MKIFKSASLVLAFFLFFGMNVQAASPNVIVSASGEVQVENIGNNIAGIEVTLQLSSGSFESTPFTAHSSNSYTFAKVSGSKITIYSTSQEDLATDGAVTLGSVKTSSGAVLSTSSTVNVVGQSLQPTEYSKITVTDEGANSGSTSAGSNNTGSSNSSATTTDEEDSEEVEEEIVDEDEEELLEEDLDIDDESDQYTGESGNGQETEGNAIYTLYLWLLLLFIVLTGGGVLSYMNKRKNSTKQIPQSQVNTPQVNTEDN